VMAICSFFAWACTALMARERTASVASA